VFGAIEILERGRDLDWTKLFSLPQRTATDMAAEEDADADSTELAS